MKPIRSIVRAIAWSLAATGLSSVGGCATYSSDSSESDTFLDPGRAGYYEYVPPGSAAPRNAAATGARLGDSLPILEGPFDEVWVISRTHPQAQVRTPAPPSHGGSDSGDSLPGTGSLLVADDAWSAGGAPGVAPRSGSSAAPRAFPLERTTVRADLAGPIASVRVGQRFHNPYSEKIEAVYVFPLPHDAAVDDFVLTIGDRKVRGVIRDREQAQQIYDQAKSAGYVASLLDQERSNIFMERVANIEPGKSIEVTLHFVNTLAYENDAWEWRFPMVVAPRFNPPYAPAPITALPVGGTAAGGGGATAGGGGALASNGPAHPARGGATTIEYLKNGERSGAEVDLEVHVEAGAKIRSLESTSHELDVIERLESTARLKLAARDRIPNRDFVLRYSTAGSAPSHAFVTDGSSSDGTMLLTILPPIGVRDVSRVPVEIVFILDTSGSMSGRPFDQLRDAVTAALDRLRPEDRFQIVTFSNTAQSWGSGMCPATKDAVQAARRWVSGLRAEGGTMMIEGLRAALALPHDQNSVRTLVFITDGLLSNESEILREIHHAASRDRVFALGVGSSVNWALLDGMGRVGNGAVAALSLEERADQCMERFIERVSRPVVHSMRIRFEGGGGAAEVVPDRLPDLVPGAPVTVAARFSGSPPAHATLTGWMNGRAFTTPLALAGSARSNEGVRSIWARQKIAELSREAAWNDTAACVSSIRQLALANNLVSPLTSFVAVDASAMTGGSSGVTVVQPVSMPQGIRYETTVGGTAPSPGAETPGALQRGHD